MIQNATPEIISCLDKTEIEEEKNIIRMVDSSRENVAKLFACTRKDGMITSFFIFMALDSIVRSL